MKEQTGNKQKNWISEKTHIVLLSHQFLTIRRKKNPPEGLSSLQPYRNPCPSNPAAELAANDFPRRIHVCISGAKPRMLKTKSPFFFLAVPLALSLPLVSPNSCSASFRGLRL
ncbi:hypothetical protein ATANTOWER_006437 [Ataeniobius toweri]|uniref:Uncharacterized protein n=1 Tax=Ataeniobius toweri TaxID=208326 RepID=A0ABU7ANU4_9TELE|nr:hypothetical protein [Ataeniobius toweri]